MFDFQIGRRIFRQRLETGDRDGDLEQRRVSHYFVAKKLSITSIRYLLIFTMNETWPFLTFSVQAFQKLIYVSNIVFGDASSFLLPWKRMFKVTDAQVYDLYLFPLHLIFIFVLVLWILADMIVCHTAIPDMSYVEGWS